MKPLFTFARRARVIRLCVATLALASTALLAPCSFADGDQSPAEVAAEVVAPSPPKVGEMAADFELKDLQDRPVKLSLLAGKTPVVLVMLRGFPGYQCPFCTAQVGALLAKADEFAAAGVHVLLVYPGASAQLKEHASEFVGDNGLPTNFTFVLDPDFAFTRQYGLRWDAPGETSYPATFVVDTDLSVLFSKVSHSHGDRATPDEILAALRK